MIYLHFLDRELRESINAKINCEELSHIILVAVYMNDDMRMSYSHYFETCLNDEQLSRIVKKLNNIGLLKCYTSHNCHDDFIKAHKVMYLHDKSRYPYYFDDNLSDPQLKLEKHCNSTTEELYQKMLVSKVLSGEYDENLKKQFRDFLLTIGDKAITKTAFAPFLETLSLSDSKRLSGKINTYISESYTKRYLGENNHIITGIQALAYYDKLSNQPILFNFEIYRCLIETLIPSYDNLDTIESLANSGQLNNIKLKLSFLLKSLMELTFTNLNDSSFLNAENVLNNLKELITNVKFRDDSTIEQKIFCLQEAIIIKKELANKHKCDFLLVCATSEELDSILQQESWFRLENGYYLRRNKKDIVLAQVGTGMVNASITGQKLISMYRPNMIIMVGFCAGSHGDVNLGDVILAEKIYNYSTGKQLTSEKILNEQETYLLPQAVFRRVSTLRDYKFSDAITLPKDFDLQVWQFLSKLAPLSCLTTDNLDLSCFPNWTEILQECQDKNYVTITDGKMHITKVGKEYLDNVALTRPEGIKQYKPMFRTGVMACGCYVQQQEEIFSQLKNRERKTIALDMESYAIAKLAAENNIEYFVIKGVGDFANAHKSFANRFIPYSTYNAYYIALQILNVT